MSKQDVNENNELSKEKRLNTSGQPPAKTAAQEVIPTPPDGGYGWVVVVAAFMINVIVDGIAYSYGVFLGELEKYYGSPTGITSMVGSLLSGTYLLTSPLASFLITRYDSRIVTICGSVISTFGFVISQFSPTIEVMMITFGLIGGFGFGLMYLPAVVSVSFYFEKRRALTTGIVVCGTGVGCFVFAPLLQAAMDGFGWKYSMVIVAGITLQGIVFGALLRPLKSSPKKARSHTTATSPTEGRKQRESEVHKHSSESVGEKGIFPNGESKESDEPNQDVEKQRLTLEQDAVKRSSIRSSSVASIPVVIHGSTLNISTGTVNTTREKSSFLQTTGIYLLADPLFLIPILANLIAMLGHYIPFFYIVRRSVSVLEITESKAAWLLSTIAITNTLGRILMGFLADIKSVNSLLLHNIAIATSGVACILSMACLNFALTAIFAAYFGLCMATWISLSPIILCELLGLEKLTNAFGLLCFVRGIGSFAGPPLAGMVYDKTNNYNNAFHVGGVLLLVGGSIVFLLHLPYFQRKTYANQMRKKEAALAKDAIGLHVESRIQS